MAAHNRSVIPGLSIAPCGRTTSKNLVFVRLLSPIKLDAGGKSDLEDNAEHQRDVISRSGADGRGSKTAVIMVFAKSKSGVRRSRRKTWILAIFNQSSLERTAAICHVYPGTSMLLLLMAVYGVSVSSAVTQPEFEGWGKTGQGSVRDRRGESGISERTI